MIIAVDLGYGFVKAVGPSGEKMLFPQALAPATEDLIERDLRLGGKRPGYRVELRPQGSITKSTVFIGDLALRESRGARMSLGRDRFGEAERKVTIAHTMTAAYLAGAEGQTTLAFGLPLAWYRQQKAAVIQALLGAGMYVKVDNGPEKYIQLDHVEVFPQGVGALFAAPKLPREGTVGLVDIGYYTTDYLLVEIHPEGVDPLANFMSSVEVGIHTALRFFGTAFNQETGKPLSATEALAVWDRQAINFERKRLVDVAGMKRVALAQVGDQLLAEIKRVWAEKTFEIERIFLAGGGAYEFVDLFEQEMGGVELLEDAQFANAVGFLRMAERMAALNDQKGQKSGAVVTYKTQKS